MKFAMLLLGASLTLSPGLGLQSGPWKFSPRARRRLAPASCSTPTRTQTTFKWDLCYSNVVVKECAAVSTWGPEVPYPCTLLHPILPAAPPGLARPGQSWPLVKKKKVAWMNGSLLSEPLAGYVILVCGKELTKKKKKKKKKPMEGRPWVTIQT